MNTVVGIVLSTMMNTGVVPVEHSVKDVICLTEAINWESGNQPYIGKVGMAHVALNRLKSKAFPSESVCGILYQRGQFDYHAIKRASVRSSDNKGRQQLEKSAEVALKVLAGKTKDPTGGATFYVNMKVATDTTWIKGMRVTRVLGDHTFMVPKKGFNSL